MAAKEAEIKDGHDLLLSYLNKKVEIKETNGDIHIGVLAEVNKDFVKLTQGTGSVTKDLIIFYQGISSLKV